MKKVSPENAEYSPNEILSPLFGIGIKAPENLESAVLNFALTALIDLNQTSYIFHWKK